METYEGDKVERPRPRRWYENAWGEWLFPVNIPWQAAFCGYFAFAAWLYFGAMMLRTTCICCIVPVMTSGLIFPVLSLGLGWKFRTLRKKNPHLRGRGRVFGGVIFSILYLFMFLLLVLC
ncbi:MAG: hypothetical protein Q4D62_13450 [Planctomycetia bacterium]|nr:hypothetical protein [Planctomycetia bacterium]